MNDSKLLSAFIATEAKIEASKRSSKQQTNKTDAEKRANLLDEIFYYTHIVPCQRLFSLAWYDDITYALDTKSSLSKALFISCCNRPSCQNIEPEFL